MKAESEAPNGDDTRYAAYARLTRKMSRPQSRRLFAALDQLSLTQLRDVQNHIETLQHGLPKGMSGAEFVALMQELREKYQITDEEAEEFDRILT